MAPLGEVSQRTQSSSAMGTLTVTGGSEVVEDVDLVGVLNLVDDLLITHQRSI